MAIFLITAVGLPLLLTEFGDWCPWVAVRLVRWAARHLGDPESCARYEEEWLANLHEVPGKLASLAAALGYLAYMPRMRRSIRLRLARSRSSTSQAALALPPMPRSFVGRTMELDALIKLLRAADSEKDYQPICLYGVGGVGKTTLATICAHQMKEAFPDGLLFLHVPYRATMDRCRDDILLALGIPPGRIPPGQASKSAMLRDHLSNRRVLIVLDDIEPKQVHALFGGGPPCPVLVTSVQSPDQSPVGKALALSGLGQADAYELLRSRLGKRVDAEPEAATELLEILAGHPLAITVTAALLATDPSSTIATLLRQLGREMTGHAGKNLRAALDTIYARLTKEQRALLFRLSLLPDAPFGIHEAAKLMGTEDVANIAHDLCSFVRIGFLASAEGDDSNLYVLHHLIRAYARERPHHDESPDRIQSIRARLRHQGPDPPDT